MLNHHDDQFNRSFKRQRLREQLDQFTDDGLWFSQSIKLHQVVFTFKSRRSEFITSLKKIYPPSWQTQITGEVIFCHHINDPQFENYQPYELTLEDDLIIQRDFIACTYQQHLHVLFNQHIEDFPDGLRNVTRWLLFNRLPQFDKVCFHSSIVIDQSRAYIFLGPSGAGKSTVTQLSKPRLHLGDDMNILWCNHQNIYAQIALLGQQYEDQKQADQVYGLDSIYWLHQSNQNALSLMDKSTCLLRLYQSLPNLGMMDRLNQQKASQLCHQIAAEIPAYDLYFTKNDSFWEMIHEH